MIIESSVASFSAADKELAEKELKRLILSDVKATKSLESEVSRKLHVLFCIC